MLTPGARALVFGGFVAFSCAFGGEAEADAGGDAVEGDSGVAGVAELGGLAVGLVEEEAREDEEGDTEAGEPAVHG